MESEIPLIIFIYSYASLAIEKSGPRTKKTGERSFMVLTPFQESYRTSLMHEKHVHTNKDSKSQH